MGGGEKAAPQSILEYKEYNTDTTVKFIVKMAASKMKEAESKGLHKFFSLQTSMSCGNLLVGTRNNNVKFILSIFENSSS